MINVAMGAYSRCSMDKLNGSARVWLDHDSEHEYSFGNATGSFASTGNWTLDGSPVVTHAKLRSDPYNTVRH